MTYQHIPPKLLKAPWEDVRAISFQPGRHASPAEGICAMELVALLAGLPFSDNPSCTSPVIASFVRGLNDNMPAVTRNRLRPFVPRLIGTVAPHLEEARTRLLAVAAVNRIAAAALRAHGFRHHANYLAQLDTLGEAAEAADRISRRLFEASSTDERHFRRRLAISLYQASRASRAAIFYGMEQSGPPSPESDVGEWAAFSACNAFASGAESVWTNALEALGEIIGLQIKA